MRLSCACTPTCASLRDNCAWGTRVCRMPDRPASVSGTCPVSAGQHQQRLLQLPRKWLQGACKGQAPSHFSHAINFHLLAGTPQST